MATERGGVQGEFDLGLTRVFEEHRRAVEGMRQEASQDAKRLAERWADFEKLLERLRDQALRPIFTALNAKLGPITPSVARDVDGALISLSLRRDDLHPADAGIRLSLAHDDAFEKLMVTYQFGVVPLLMEVEPEQRFETPIDGADVEGLRSWLSERVLGSTRSYLSMETNPHYQKRAMAMDPVLKESFPAHLAVGEVEHGGKKYRFKSEESRRMFEADPDRFAGRL